MRFVFHSFVLSFVVFLSIKATKTTSYKNGLEKANKGSVTETIVIPDKPLVDPVQNFCFDDNVTLTIGDLQVLGNPLGHELNWYEAETGGAPIDPSTALVDLKIYFAEFTDSSGEKSLRTQSKAFISNPVLTADINEICLGETATISVSGIPQTPQDFINDHPELTLFLEDNTTNTAYFLKEQSMTWTAAYDLIQSYGASASMYIINSKREEDLVFNRLLALGYAGNTEYHFWLGLKQYPELNPNNRINEGWYWLDGRPLTADLANWNTGEPNDFPTQNGEAGDEDYGQFDFFVNKRWNDMTNNSVANGNSWPVFEFNGATDISWGAYTDQTQTEVVYFPEKSSKLTVTPTETTTYFLESESNGVVCRAEFTLIVNQPPVINTIDPIELCDDATDGDDTNGILESIDLEAQTAIILGTSLDPLEHEVTYHLSQANADNLTNLGLSSPYTNIPGPNGEPQTIFVRVLNTVTGCFSSDSSFEIIIHPLPKVEDVGELIVCDDTSVGSDTDGFINNFDLTSQTAAILGGQDPAIYSVSYHLSPEDANDITKIGLSSPHQNTQKDGETIYIRVLNTLTQCFRAEKSFELVVAPLPILKSDLIRYEQCDDDEANDGISLFNLTLWEELFSDNHQNENFEYYKDSTFDPTSLILDPVNYFNEAFEESIFIKVISNENCERNVQLNLRVGASLIDPSFMKRFALCEDSPVDQQDGIVSFEKNILTSIAEDLIASDPKFSAQNVALNLYESKEDALTNTNPIDTSLDYSNSIPWEQPIWASIQNTDIETVECIGLKQVGTLYVEPKPIAHEVSLVRQCDGNSFVDEDAQDGQFPFVTSGVENQLFEDQTGVVAYYYAEDGTFIGNTLPNPFLSPSQTLTINVELASLLTDVINLDGNCYDTTTLELIVDESPKIYPVTIPPNCDDGSDDTDGFSEFDTSTIEATLLGGQTNMIVRYFDENDVELSSPLPNPFNTQTQTIRAAVENPINNNCTISVDINFVVNPLPVFEVEDDKILCLNIGPVNIGAFNTDGNYSYSWTYTNSNGETKPLGVNTATIFAKDEGEYLVTATKTDGTNCSRSRSIVVKNSNIATITVADIRTQDLTNDNNNSITINTDNLGEGDYEFSVDNSFGPFQDEPYFDQIKPGVHTLFVRDKNFCGLTQVDFPIIGYSKYFTPNGDGYGDRWKILGLNAEFQPKSKVYLLDRFGKLIGEIDPRSEGWDGTLNGNPMPATDYWFRVYLEDGREFKGHFSLVRGW